MEEYTIVLESQLGPREGTLQLEGGKEGAVSGWITLVGEKNAVQGRWIGAHLLQLFHHLRTQISNLECVSVLRLEGIRSRAPCRMGRIPCCGMEKK